MHAVGQPQGRRQVGNGQGACSTSWHEHAEHMHCCPLCPLPCRHLQAERRAVHPGVQSGRATSSHARSAKQTSGAWAVHVALRAWYSTGLHAAECKGQHSWPHSSWLAGQLTAACTTPRTASCACMQHCTAGEHHQPCGVHHGPLSLPLRRFRVLPGQHLNRRGLVQDRTSACREQGASLLLQG